MGLLAPLYALAALAVAAPILFHLIRRQPTGQNEFSSLMFLQASPPRLTKRSRIDNWWLLLVRAAALLLVAFAFARPYLRSTSLEGTAVAGRRVLVLVDTSGSMQRESVWAKTQTEVKEFIRGLAPNDRVALATLDTELKVLQPFDESATINGNPEAPRSSSTPLTTQSSLLGQVDALRPNWRATRLAECLIAAVDLLQERDDRSDAQSASTAGEVVLFSDLHEGAELDALQGFEWPENVRLDVRRIKAATAGNARPSLMPTVTESSAANSATPSAAENSSGTPNGNRAVRIRVANNRNSQSNSFELHWAVEAPRENGAQLSASVIPLKDNASSTPIQVPAGQVRVVSMPPRPPKATCILLTGDAENFDNVVHVPEAGRRHERMLFIGTERTRPEDDLFYYIKNIPFGSAQREVAVERLSMSDLQPTELQATLRDSSVAGVFIEAPVPENLAQPLRDFARSGRSVIVCLARPYTSTDASDLAGLRRLFALPELQLREATGRDFALLSDIEFAHPLFAPFADAKFNDFGKIRFWNHRVAELGTGQASADTESTKQDFTVVARFDDQSPAIVHQVIERGDLWLLTSGWQVTSSQLALSSKFVPIMLGMLDPRGLEVQATGVYAVGQTVPMPEGLESQIVGEDASSQPSGRRVSDGWVFEEPQGTLIRVGDRQVAVAIELPDSESQLDPLDVDRFEQLGVLMGQTESAVQRAASERQLQVQELEGQQKLWQWLLAGALLLLAGESWIAGRIQARSVS